MFLKVDKNDRLMTSKKVISITNFCKKFYQSMTIFKNFFNKKERNT